MPIKKISYDTDHQLTRILNALFQPLSAPPAAAQGRFYYDSTKAQLGVSDGTAWFYMSSLTNAAVQDLIGATLTGTQVVPTYNSTTKVLTLTIGTGVIVDAMVAGNAAISADKLANGTTNVIMLATERTKLTGVQTGATANSTDAQLRDRSTHTGTQLAATISDFLANVYLARLDQLAAPTNPVGLNAQRITNLADPTSPQDAATKAYVDAAAQGLDVKPSVRAATTANITLSGLQTVDGITLVAGDRVLVKNQTTASQNGLYIAASGAWTRSTDADTSPEVTSGLFTFVESGTTLAATGWLLTTQGAITLGTTGLTFTQFSGNSAYIGGNGITISGNTIAALVLAGGGLLNGASGLSLDPAVAVRHFAQTVGDGTTTSFVVTHGLNTRELTYSCYDTSTFEFVDIAPVATTVNSITVAFASAPATGQYRVTVHG